MPLVDIRASFELADGEKAPSEFILLKSGANSWDGGEMLFDADAGKSVLATYAKRGIQLTADYEHQSLEKGLTGPIPNAAKKWVPEVRDGALWATNISWTKRAKQMLEDGEYRYFSIAARVDSKSNRVKQVINFALTNNPAAHGIQPLVSASITSQPENEMKTILVALGLSADAEESAAVTKAARLIDLEREVLALTACKSLTEAMGVLAAHKASQDQVVALNAKVKQLEGDTRGKDFDALVKQGGLDRKLSPAQVASDWITRMRAREDGIVELKSYLATAPALVEKPDDAKKADETVEITQDEIKVAKAMVGTDPVALKAHLDALREHRAARAKR